VRKPWNAQVLAHLLYSIKIEHELVQRLGIFRNLDKNVKTSAIRHSGASLSPAGKLKKSAAEEEESS
jgi:hypothetical protein